MSVHNFNIFSVNTNFNVFAINGQKTVLLLNILKNNKSCFFFTVKAGNVE